MVKGPGMVKAKKYTPEQIVNILRQIEVGIANSKTHPIACCEVGITEQFYYRWRKEYGGLKVDQAKRLKELEQDNGKLQLWLEETIEAGQQVTIAREFCTTLNYIREKSLEKKPLLQAFFKT
jgi:hypothetical protein